MIFTAILMVLAIIAIPPDLVLISHDLVADALPHLDYAQDEDYAAEMVRARRKGIKIFAVASSGMDQQGEYVFRQLAQQTMGRFLFILYRTGPQGSLETPTGVEQYTAVNGWTGSSCD